MRRGSRRRSRARARLRRSRARLCAEARASRRREQLLEHLAEPGHVVGGTRTPVTSTSPPTAVATTGRPCHRLARDDAVALAPGRNADDGRALVVRAELRVRDEADRLRDVDRAGADDHARQALRRGEEVVDPFSGERRPTRARAADRRLADRRRNLDAARDDAHRRERRARAHRPGTRTRRWPAARRTSGRKSQGARRASSTSVPQSWTTYGFPVASAASPEGASGRARGRLLRGAAGRAGVGEAGTPAAAAPATACGAGCRRPWPYAIP